MAIVNNGNIILLDPNEVNTNPNMVNSIPQYEDMFIYAELRAVRKGRTVLETSSEQGNGGNILKTGLEDFTEVSFLGTDQNKTSPIIIVLLQDIMTAVMAIIFSMKDLV